MEDYKLLDGWVVEGRDGKLVGVFTDKGSAKAAAGKRATSTYVTLLQMPSGRVFCLDRKLSVYPVRINVNLEDERQ